MKRFGVLVATVGGAGYSPVAPGTVGSAVGVGIYFLTRAWPLAWQAGLVIAISALGVWAAGVAETHFGREDPGQVVVDEVAGQLVTLFGASVAWPGMLLAFVAFRLFDITKPWPVNRFESLPRGLGIMADDLMAGVYGAVVVQLAIRFVPGVW